MKLIAKEKEVNLVPTTRKIVEITEKHKSKNLNELYFKAMKDSDLKMLAIIINELSEDDKGKKAFNGDINVVYDFIDNWKRENNKTYLDLFQGIAEMVNEQGFFLKMMTAEELEDMIKNPLASFDMEKIINNSAEKAVEGIISEEFKGHKA